MIGSISSISDEQITLLAKRAEVAVWYLRDQDMRCAAFEIVFRRLLNEASEYHVNEQHMSGSVPESQEAPVPPRNDGPATTADAGGDSGVGDHPGDSSGGVQSVVPPAHSRRKRAARGS